MAPSPPEFFGVAQSGPSAIEALSVRGVLTNSAEVYRVDGAPVPDGYAIQTKSAEAISFVISSSGNRERFSIRVQDRPWERNL